MAAYGDFDVADYSLSAPTGGGLGSYGLQNSGNTLTGTLGQEIPSGLGDMYSDPYSFSGMTGGTYGLQGNNSSTGYGLGDGRTGLGLTGTDQMDNDGWGNVSDWAKKMSGYIGNKIGIPGVGTAVQLGSARTSGQMANAMGSTFGALLGGAVAGPPGALGGGYLGGLAGNFLGGNGKGPDGTTSNAGSTSGGSTNAGGNDMLGTLAQLYAASQANKGLSGASSANGAVNQQISQLSDMYGQNSPYAQQLRQTLERKDAAAGRRSQYGPREVQLQAALADKATQAADTIGRLATSGQSNQLALQKQKQQTQAQQLALLMNLGKQSGLGNLFSNGGGITPGGFGSSLGGSSGFDVGSNYDWNP